jgi:hypothetical protein
MSCGQGNGNGNGFSSLYFTEGDTQPPMTIGFPYDISAKTISVLVERPDGTTFERAATKPNNHQALVEWQDTDWVEGCSRLWIKIVDGTEVTTLEPIGVKVGKKPVVSP